jgi:acyl-coenzyme A thioesterase PaaI-like protein
MAHPPAIQDLVPHNNCWGCGPENEAGLRIKSYLQGEDTVCTWQPGPPFFAGPEHVLNGGIIAAIIDCHSICCAIADHYRREQREIGSAPDIWCVTASISIGYVRPVPIDQPVTLHATVKERGARSSTVACTLSSNGTECAHAEVVAVRVPHQWRQRGE